MGANKKLKRSIMEVQDWCTTLEDRIAYLEDYVERLNGVLVSVNLRLENVEEKLRDGQ